MADPGTSTPDPATLTRAVADVLERIAVAAAVGGRTGEDVHVLAATKYLDPATSAALVAAGVGHIAENRLDGLVAKRASGAVPDGARWHFIGRLQSRQAVAIASHVDAIHTLCTSSAAARLAAGQDRPALLVQVNVDGDPAKDGLAPDDVERFLAELPEALVVRGLMAMPAATEQPEESRAAFAVLRELRDQLAATTAGRHSLAWLSMGTSQDFAVAVEEGATHVRLGRILYAGGELRG